MRAFIAWARRGGGLLREAVFSYLTAVFRTFDTFANSQLTIMVLRTTSIWRTLYPSSSLHQVLPCFTTRLLKPHIASSLQPYAISLLRPYAISSLQSRASSSLRPNSSQSTSLTWRPIHDEAPASYGVIGYDGWVELIPRDTLLPFRKTITMYSALDYTREGTFSIAGRLNMLERPKEIRSEVCLKDIRLGKAGQAKIKITMRLAKDLTGSLTAWDVWTRDTVTVDFDGHQHLQGDRTDARISDDNY